MKVRLITLMAGPGGVHQAGTVIEVADEIGVSLVKGGFAEVVVERAAPIETATVEQGEMAVAPAQSGTKGRKGEGRKGASTPSAATRGQA